MSATAIPAILDTDIGTDIDDTWALAMMLRSRELDVKLVTSDTGNVVYRAKLIAKMLTAAGRTDVPVGLGVGHKPEAGGPQMPWVQDYDLADYPGPVHEDGVAAIIATIEASPRPVTLIAIGPVPNVAEFVRRRPDLAARTDFVGMQGSIARHERDAAGAIAEYNVVQDIPAAQTVFAAATWRSITITPLDTCGSVVLDGELYQRVLASDDPATRAVVANYRIWAGVPKPGGLDPAVRSSVLYDTVAAHLAYSHEFLTVRPMRIAVTEDGYTREDEAGATMNVAVEWTDKPGYLAELTRRLTEGA
jgi:inosine-uridine nucleoside N-ribohydrolase